MFEKLRKKRTVPPEPVPGSSKLPVVSDGPGPGSKSEPSKYIVKIDVARGTTGAFKWVGYVFISKGDTVVKKFYKRGDDEKRLMFALENAARTWVEDQRKVESGNLSKTVIL
jgi:hypothetical protein